MVREGLSDKASFEQSPEGSRGSRLVYISKRIPSTCEGPDSNCSWPNPEHKETHLIRSKEERSGLRSRDSAGTDHRALRPLEGTGLHEQEERGARNFLIIPALIFLSEQPLLVQWRTHYRGKSKETKFRLLG